MDGRGRALDNVFVERLWRSVKYEEVYLKDYADGWEAEQSLGRYFQFYCRSANPPGPRLPDAGRSVRRDNKRAKSSALKSLLRQG